MTDPAPATSAPAAAPGGSCNLVPYACKPFPQPFPPRLAALATMLGLSPPAVSEARVLELGRAVGGNIIPPALRFRLQDSQTAKELTGANLGAAAGSQVARAIKRLANARLAS